MHLPTYVGTLNCTFIPCTYLHTYLHSLTIERLFFRFCFCKKNKTLIINYTVEHGKIILYKEL